MNDRPRVFSQRAVTARKEHRCCECLKPIHKGEQYRRYTGIWEENGPQTYKHCMGCASLWDEANRIEPDPEYGPAFGRLHDFMLEIKQ